MSNNKAAGEDSVQDVVRQSSGCEYACEVYIIDKSPNKSKLAPRSKKSIVVGFSEDSEGYIVGIPSEGKTQISREISFPENKPDEGRGTPDDYSSVRCSGI